MIVQTTNALSYAEAKGYEDDWKFAYSGPVLEDEDEDDWDEDDETEDRDDEDFEDSDLDDWEDDDEEDDEDSDWE